MQYKTIQGDTWDIIAKRVYGNELRIDHLIRANPTYRTVVIFPAGVDLKVPELKDDLGTSEQELPPWKRGRG